MRLLALLASLALALTLRPAPADACSFARTPRASLVARTDGPGVQPWFHAHYLSKAPRLLAVAASCPRAKVCRGRVVAIEGGRDFVRPAHPLTAGQRYQLVATTGPAAQRLLADFTAQRPEPAPTLAAWDGLTITSADVEQATTTCSTRSRVVRATVKNWSKHEAALANHLLLLYTSRPDATRPTRGLRATLRITNANLVLQDNFFFGRWIDEPAPSAVWAILADDQGNLGAPIELRLP